MTKSEYWRERCILAETYIRNSPCDPDITLNQLTSYKEWLKFISDNEVPS